MSKTTVPRGERAETAALGRLARLHGLQPADADGLGRRRRVPHDTLVAALRALGVPLEGRADAVAAERARERAGWGAPLEPVVTVWRGRPAGCEIRGPAAALRGQVDCILELEDGGIAAWTAALGRRRVLATASLDGERFVSRQLALPRRLPLGYHTLRVELAGRRHEALVIVAPRRAYDPGRRDWGAFLPTYALRTANSWGLGDFTDVDRLLAWLGDLGGGMFSTLPLLATFLGRQPFDPSPYAPASRLFWNELYVDPRRTPEFARSRRAQTLVASAPFGREVAALARARHVDYARAMRLRRRVLELLAAEVDTRDDARAAAFRCFQRGRAAARRYAAFRAAGERHAKPWPEWPARLRDGRLDESDYAPAHWRYHAYAQWIAAEQVAALADHAHAVGPGLYLDVPLGVHPYGYDVWAYRGLFATEVAAGAPPDALFTRGQNWGFPPLQPEAIRRDRYRYVRSALGHTARHAGALRLDHVMGLHRLYWIPDGCAATAGVYVHYRPEELYAILTLESHRRRVAIIGENLGTVPPEVNRAMDAHGLRKMYVLQFEVQPHAARRPLRPVPRHAVASLNTHDLPTFAAFLRGLDVDASMTLGWLSPRQAAVERRRRTRLRRALARAVGAASPDNTLELLRGSLERLARSAASLVLVNLEDLWGETAPQNLPGTGHGRPNWRRKARYAFESFRDRPEVVDLLRAVADTRAKGESK